MLFSLEALRARYGDALLLHYGSVDDPQLVIVDGGPGGVFRDAMRPRLREIVDLLDLQGPLRARLAMVSHIDGDHIQGIIELLRHIRDDRAPGVRIDALWHNSFDDLLGNTELAALDDLGTSVDAATAAGLGLTSWDQAFAAGVQQARRLRDLASQMQLRVNSGVGSQGFVASGLRLDLDGGLTMHVLAPAAAQLEGLQAEWDVKVGNMAALSDDERRAAVADYLTDPDTSPANLSSVVVHMTLGGRTMLLTGDARADHILDGLAAAGLMDSSGRCHVDLLKVPHHGSDRNVSRDFFFRVPARHYVISGDGDAHHGSNPDVSTLEMLTRARRHARYTIHSTYRLQKIVDFIARDRATHTRNYETRYGDDSYESIWVDLGDDPLDF